MQSLLEHTIAMMKNLVTLTALALLGLTHGELVIETYLSYHEAVGIPLAVEIYEAESKITGEDNLNGRIIGGSATKLGDGLSVGGLLIDLKGGAQSVCGSTLVSSKRTLTAAHCWWDGRNQGTEVTLVHGSLKLYSGGTRTKTKDVTTHEKWNPRMLTDDIAMIKHPEITFTDVIKAMALPTDSMAQDTFEGVTGTVTGYGRTSSDNSGAITKDQVQRQVNLTVAENKACKDKFGKYYRDTNICVTGPKNAAKSTCQGDSGSGLITKVKEINYVIGIVSFGGRRCDRPNPIVKVFTRITKYIDWIKNKLK